jgi:hypothetical protein
MSDHVVLLGLPGLYQNWLLSALDVSAQVRMSGEHNFVSHSGKIKWFLKMGTDLGQIPELMQTSMVINSYVLDENFVWYLYNFLEKTDDVGILVDNLPSNLFSKAQGTVAFDGLLKHLVDNYQLSSAQDLSYLNNAAIENFYLMLIDQDGKFKIKTRYYHPGCINVEFRDFENYDVLASRLDQVPGFDLSYFEHRYQHLVARNYRYLTRQKTFIDRLNSNDNDFDILETAYIGWLLWKLSPVRLDWFNTKIRKSSMENNWDKICNLAKMFYNKQT